MQRYVLVRIELDEMIQHGSNLINEWFRKMQQLRNPRSNLWIVPAGFDGQIRDIRLLRGAEDSNPNYEMLVGGDDCAFLGRMLQGVGHCIIWCQEPDSIQEKVSSYRLCLPKIHVRGDRELVANAIVEDIHRVWEPDSGRADLGLGYQIQS